MKANRKFVQADEAVSPVIAVILMVAITVVLAATVFVLVSDIGGNTATSAPTISWTADESQDRLTVSTASQNADWFRLTAQADSCVSTANINAGNAGSGTPPAAVTRNTPGTAAGAEIATGANCGTAQAVRIGAATGKIGAGDYLEFCHEGAAAATNVKITLKDTTANAVVHSYTFTDVAIC